MSLCVLNLVDLPALIKHDTLLHFKVTGMVVTAMLVTEVISSFTFSTLANSLTGAQISKHKSTCFVPVPPVLVYDYQIVNV